MITFDLFEGEDRDRIRDTVTKAAIIKARARHPAATSDIEALAQDMIDTQKHDEQELEKAQEVNVRQDELLKQIRALDRRQDSEIDQVEDEENRLEQKIEMLRAANEKLAQTVANMRSRKKNAEVKLDESGPEIWTVHFTDGSTAKIRVPSDETDPALVRKHFAKQGRTVAKFDYGFGHEPAAGPGPEAHEPGSGTAISARTGERLPESNFNRAGYNPIRGKSDYADKRAHLFDLLSHSGMAPEDKQVIRQRLLDLDTEARKQGLIK